MDTGRALLAEILANPTDDLPRMVYADWLDEQGHNDRATYIRCEVAVPVRKHRWCDKTHAKLAARGVSGPLFVPRCRCRTCSTIRKAYMASRRHIHVEWERELRRAGYERWRNEFAERDFTLMDELHIPFVHAAWERGFVDEIWCDLRGLEYHGREVFALCPMRVIHLQDIRERWEIVAPEDGFGWECSYFLNGESNYYELETWETRDEMVDAILSHAGEAMAT